jgi:PKD repeat protein
MYRLSQITLTSILFILSFSPIFGQSNNFDHSNCATTADLATIERLARHNENIASFASQRSNTSVPVTAHLISQTNGLNALSEVDLNAAIDLMNEHYINANIEFFLCGVNNIADDTYYDFNSSQENLMSATYNVPNTINLYIAGTVSSNSGASLCGYTHFPGQAGDQVIMAKGCMTNGSTLSHEFGHYLGLYHTHGKTNSSTTDESTEGSNCLFAGDDVCDTAADPNIHGQVSNCEYTGDSEFTPDVQNLMSYAPSGCRMHFSEGQLTRAAFMLATERNYLICGGLSANFTASETFSPCGDPLTVTFTHTGSGATTWTWDLGDGTNTTTETNSITHTYENTGSYSVSLTVGDGENYVSKMEPQFISVQSISTENYLEEFTNGTSDWSIVNEDAGNKWLPVTNYLYSGNTVMAINNYSGNQQNQKDILQSRSFDLTGWDSAKLSFKLSYKPLYYTSTFFISDSLEVAYSSDCGATYQTLYLKTGVDLSTTTTVNSTRWFPESEADWRTEEINLPEELMNETVHFCIINRSKQGNYLYFDDFKVEQTNALPAELIEFTAQEQGKGVVELNWVTANEKNVSHFEVEYSQNGTDWSTKAWVSAAGNSDKQEKYRSKEIYPKGKVWLRLAIIDLDGSKAYSSVLLAESEAPSISVFPNPTTDFINISAKENTSFQLNDMSGKTVSEFTTNENGQVTVDMTELPLGVYFLQNSEESFRIVKL